MPARASMLTGTYPHNHHIQENAGSLPPDEEGYAHLLREAGYATAYVGKTHFGSDNPRRDLHLSPGESRAPAQPAGPGVIQRSNAAGAPEPPEPNERQRGFDYVHQIPGPMALTRAVNHLTRRWEELGLLERYREDYRRRAADPGAGAWASPLPVEEFADTYVGARAEEWLRGYQEPRPFLLVVGFGGPHPPFDAPEPYASRYRPEDLRPPSPPGSPGTGCRSTCGANGAPQRRRPQGREHARGTRRGGGGGAHLPAADGQLRGQDRPDRRPRGAPPGRPGRAGVDGEHPGDLPLRPRRDGGRPRALPQVRLLRVPPCASPSPCAGRAGGWRGAS